MKDGLEGENSLTRENSDGCSPELMGQQKALVCRVRLDGVYANGVGRKSELWNISSLEQTIQWFTSQKVENRQKIAPIPKYLA